MSLLMLDQIIAHDLMGYQPCTCYPQIGNKICPECSRMISPRYSSCEIHSKEVIRKLMSYGFTFLHSENIKDQTHRVFFMRTSESDSKAVYADARNLPLATCLAACKALNFRIPKEFQKNNNS